MLLPVFAYLAARDFNARDGKYIPAFAGLGECDKRINITLADSREVGAGVVDTVLGSLAWQQLAVRYGGDQRSPLGPTWEDLSSLLAGQTSLHGVVGPGRSSQSMEIAPLTGALDILQLSYWAASPHLDQKRDFPRFGRTITPGQPWGEAVVELWVELNLTHAAVLFINDAYGRGYLEAVKLDELEEYSALVELMNALPDYRKWRSVQRLGEQKSPAERFDKASAAVRGLSAAIAAGSLQQQCDGDASQVSLEYLLSSCAAASGLIGAIAGDRQQPAPPVIGRVRSGLKAPWAEDLQWHHLPSEEEEEEKAGPSKAETDADADLALAYSNSEVQMYGDGFNM